MRAQLPIMRAAGGTVYPWEAGYGQNDRQASAGKFAALSYEDLHALLNDPGLSDSDRRAAQMAFDEKKFQTEQEVDAGDGQLPVPPIPARPMPMMAPTAQAAAPDAPSLPNFSGVPPMPPGFRDAPATLNIPGISQSAALLGGADDDAAPSDIGQPPPGTPGGISSAASPATGKARSYIERMLDGGSGEISDKDKWMALATAGFGAAASQAHSPLQAFGQGAQLGLSSYRQSQQDAAQKQMRAVALALQQQGQDESSRAARAREGLGERTLTANSDAAKERIDVSRKTYELAARQYQEGKATKEALDGARKNLIEAQAQYYGDAKKGETQYDRKVKSYVARGFSQDDAEDYAGGLVRLKTDPVTNQPTLVNVATGEIKPLVLEKSASPEGAGSQPDKAPSAPVKPKSPVLWDSIKDVPGVVGAAKELYGQTAGQVGAPIDKTAVNNRQMFRDAKNELVRSLATNPRYAEGEAKRIGEEINIGPSLMDSEESLKTRMRAVDTSLRRRLSNEIAARDDTSLPVSTRRAAAQAAKDIGNFINTMGVPQEGSAPSKSPSKIDSGLKDLSDSDILKQLGVGN